MCGICGEVRFDGSVTRADRIAAMRDTLEHRGPDDAGVFVSPDGRAGLGFRRLRIIDLNASANQPMSNEDGSVHVVFNGEIYNFRELRKQLESRGHTFRSRSDTEVIVHLYEDEGPSCVSRLDGMFAIAIWDTRRLSVVLARDRAGKKPLFYVKNASRLVFASEIKALFRDPELSIEVDPSAVPYVFMHGYVPCPGTLYRDVRQIEPGTVMSIASDGRAETSVYWQLDYPARAAPGRRVSRRDAARTVRELLTRAVERRLVSDVPLGAFLSGGVDSTIIVGLMSRLTGQAVKTFSIGFEGDDRYDETSYARLVADRFATEHTEFRVAPSSAVDLIDKLIWHHDGPFADASALPTFIVSELTRRHVTVVLNGDGADEVFAGYRRFQAALLSERIPGWASRLAETLLAQLPGNASERHPLTFARRFVAAARLPLAERMTRWSSVFYEDLEELCLPHLMSPNFDRLSYLGGQRERLERLTVLGKALSINYATYLLDDLLVKVDRCTMANSLEARSPFLDTALVEYVATLPDDMKIRGRQTKSILKEAFADLLPPQIVSRPKMGFGVPLGTWFRGPLREYLLDHLLNPSARYRTYLSAGTVRRVVDRHMDGHADSGLQLWTLLCFERWLQMLPSWTQQRGDVAAGRGTSLAQGET
jgi:asparagine synthase (glutamine-hydrolysing)